MKHCQTFFLDSICFSLHRFKLSNFYSITTGIDKTSKARCRWSPIEIIIDSDYTDDLGFLANTPSWISAA